MTEPPPASPSTQDILKALRDSRGKLEALQRSRNEPVAIVGIGCRFPLADSPAEFWTMLRNGVDGIGDVPADRPEFEPFFDPDPSIENRAYTRRGGFLRQRPDQFDPLFFSISEREAEGMDPQQRLLLEVTWEALEDAGIPPASLRKTPTGVFLGLSTDDYLITTTSPQKPETYSTYAGLGTARSVAAGRISYVFGFQGPCIQTDTACSSSLVAIHLACQSLRNGESTVALAAGVNLVLSPFSTIGRCRMRALAPDGTCKTFDASADGYGQGEGCGVVVLKRLSDAQRDGNGVYAIIGGSAVNHDGPSSGLTAPSELAQEQLIRQALDNARLKPSDVAYVEAHGTGTALGDPIEVNALASVFKKRDTPLLIGAVKSNIGHAEAAAGMASLIKTVLAIHHCEIPPHLHFRTPNPHIDWQNIPLRVVDRLSPWPDGKRIAGVSAFGLSGTNAHIVLQEPPPPMEIKPSVACRYALCLSAKSSGALALLVARYAEFLRQTGEPVADICYTANAGRSHFSFRVAVTGASALELADQLSTAPIPSRALTGYPTAPAIPDQPDADLIATLYRDGARLDWRGILAQGRIVRLPTYAFERKRYWSAAVPPPTPESQPSPHSEWFYVTDWESAGPSVKRKSSVPFEIHCRQPELHERLRSLLPAGTASVSEKNILWVLDPAADSTAQAVEFLEFLQTAKARVWLIALGAAPSQAPARGLAKVGILESPDSWGGVIELPTDPSDGDLKALAAEISAPSGELHIRLSDGQRLVPRLNYATLSKRQVRQSIRPDADYLITGGTGAIGIHIARWLIKQGATRVILTSRRGIDPSGLGDLSKYVRAVAVDTADVNAMGTLVRSLINLRGVVHAAGVAGGIVPLDQLNAEELREVLRPKVEGGWNLHVATASLDLDFFLLCSSIASVWGSKSQPHYTAANSFLDSLAAHRHTLGLPAQSVNWGPWEGTLSKEATDWLRRSGVRAISPVHALAALGEILNSTGTQVTVADMDWPKFKAVYEAHRPQSLLNNLASRTALPVPAPRRNLPRSEIVARLQTLVSSVLGHGIMPEPSQGFADLGLDSLMAVELKRLVEDAFGQPLSATAIFNYPTIDRLADQLIGETAPPPTASFVEPMPSMAATPELQGSALDEPIAVIGIGCRLPGGVDSPDSFWDLLESGVDAVGEIPAARFDIEHVYDGTPGAPGKSYVRHGAFLGAVDQFDPQFFGILPREAVSLDPQQRLLLEVAWEAIEDSGQVWNRAEGSAGGVFIGISGSEYLDRIRRSPSVNFDAYFVTGNALNAAAGRLSYLLGLQGPSLAIDTACSSSLVAVHLASQSLRNGECRVALAGGVSLMLSPDAYVALSQLRALSPGGRCKSFDESADGYGRGEGCGVVVLKRLSHAIADGDRIRAVIRGSAVNQDGASSGLTVPNGLAQQALIRQALASAGVEPAEVAYIEAHGTGTPLGDPIEVEAIGSVFGGRERPLLIGSVKANLGHLEAAAGVTALMKVILSLEHGFIPPHLHFTTPNSHIDWSAQPVEVPVNGALWPEGRRIAGVSSFGFTGTNAHVVLEAAPPVAATVPAPDGLLEILNLSAKSIAGLAELTERYVAHLETTTDGLADIFYSANTGRQHFRYRRAILAASPAEAIEKLKNSGSALESKPARIAFLFTGQGSQYAGMGLGLYGSEPVFRRALDRCDEILRPFLGVPLIELMGDPTQIDETAVTQPALFALEYALAELWRSRGIEPAAVMGHSVGEYVAACIAGVFSLEDGLMLIAERARLMQALPRNGAMAAVLTSPDRIEPLLLGGIAVAAYNGPANTVVSGDAADLRVLAGKLEALQFDVRPLPVSHAFHSILMEPMLDEFRTVLRRVTFNPPRIPVVSNLTGEFLESFDSGYWLRHTRDAVQFHSGLRALARQDFSAYLEIGPRPVLSSLAKQIAPDCICIPSIAPGKPESEIMLRGAGRLYELGANINWGAFYGNSTRRRVTLPTYPYQRKRYWIDETNMAISAQPVPLNPNPSPASDNASSRGPQLLAELTAVMAETFQLEPSEIRPDVPFLEMGADSIVLMGAIHAVESKYAIKISIRQLFEELSTLSALAAFLDAQLPIESAPVQASVLAPLPTQSALLPSTAIERIMREQMTAISNLFAQQLQALGAATPQFHTTATPTNPFTQQLQALGAATASLPAPPAAQSQVAATKPSLPAKATVDAFAPWRKADPSQASSLTLQQRAHLDGLIQRYTQRTQTSRRLTQTYRPILADNRASAGFRPSIKEMLYPVMAERGDGAHFIDVDGNRFLDITMGFGVLLFGHSPSFIRDAVAGQLDCGIEIGPQTRLAGEVAELVCELTGMERVTFCNSGTEAIMTALRIARAKTRKPKVAMFAGSYHGHSDQTLGMAEDGFEKPDALTIFPGIPQSAVSDMIVLDYDNPRSLDVIRARAHELAAVLVEPVQSRRPDLQPREFLHQLRAVTSECGIALIFDETITGFRSHPGGAQAWFGIQADIATYGKVPGGGMPIGLVTGRAGYMDCIDGGFWNFGDASHPTVETTFFAGTFMKHPLTMAACLAVLRELKLRGPEFQNGLNLRTTLLAQKLNSLFTEENVPIQVAHFSSLFRFVFKSNMDLFFYHLLDKGIFIWEGRNCFLSDAHTDEDVEFLVRAVRETIGELRGGGFLPGQRKEPAGPVHVPLTDAQQQIWVLAQLSDTGSAAYNDLVCLEIQGAVDPRRMQQALQYVVDRHEALRTTIDRNGQVQVIWPSRSVDLPVIQMTPAVLDVWLKDQARSPLNLTNGPILLAHLLHFDDASSMLTLRAHHTISDGWSWAVILRELSEIYSGGGSQPAAMQFREYVAWQNGQRETDAYKAKEAYWLAQFADAVPALNLPTDRPHPPTRSYHGARVTAKLDAALTLRLKQLGRSHGASLFMTMFSCFTALLHRLSNQDDFAVGMPVAGRFPDGSDGLVGYCTHILPIRSCMPDGITFSAYLQKMRKVLLDGYDHQEFPFAWLVDKLGTAQGGGRVSPINVTFNLDQPFVPPSFDGLTTSLFAAPVQSAILDLTLNVIEIEGELVLYCDYSTDLFDATTVERFLCTYRTLLECGTDNPQATLAQVPLMTPADRERVLVDWNATEATYPQRCVHELFEEQVRRTPDSPAVLDAGRSVTFAELNRLANEIAHRLIAFGAGVEAPVGICLERSVEMVAALLGILKAGGTYVPLDPAYPVARLAYMCADSGAKVLVTQRSLDGRLPDNGLQVLLLDGLTGSDEPNPVVAVKPQNLMYITYTSGSTGVPKGVEVPHRATVNRLQWMWNAVPFASGEIGCQKTVLSFVDSVWEVFGFILQGVPLVIIPDAVVKDPIRLVRLLAESRVTRFTLVPSLLRVILESDPSLSSRIPLLKYWVCSGEALSTSLCEEFRQRMPGAVLLNLYGSSEVAADVLWYDCATLADAGRQSPGVPIGRPIANTKIYLLDRAGQATPVGVPGELYASGAGLARGYRGRPDLTADRFVANPFLPGEIMYRTGDLARYLPDGKLEFLGRTDQQVKLRGVRIELGEIEAVLSAHPGVAEAVVLILPLPGGDKQIVAYVKPVDANVGAAVLREQVQSKLPGYMTPAAFILVDSFPLTPNGKVNRSALAQMEGVQCEVARPYVAPVTAAEREIVSIWGEVLALDAAHIGLDHDFFDLGGHSLRAVQVLNRVRERFAIDLSIEAIFDKQTVASLARFVEAEQFAQAAGDELSKILAEVEGVAEVRNG